MNLYLALYLMVSTGAFGFFIGVGTMDYQGSRLREWGLAVYLSCVWPLVGVGFIIERLKK